MKSPAADCYQWLPTPTQTLLLQAALLSGESTRAAWDEWNRRVGDLPRALQGPTRLWTKRLLPLLYSSAQRNGLTADAELITLLKLACAGEATRDEFCRRIGREVLQHLTREKLQPIVIRGFALAETVYPAPHLRHCHDIDIILASGRTERASTILARLGFSAHGDMEDDQLRFVHRSGLELILHRRLFPVDSDTPTLEEMFTRCQDREIAGVLSKSLAPPDSLLHVCAHAWSGERCHSPLWICDVWFLVQWLRASDWTILRDNAHRAGFQKLLNRTLDYLVLELAIDPDQYHHLRTNGLPQEY